MVKLKTKYLDQLYPELIYGDESDGGVTGRGNGGSGGYCGYAARNAGYPDCGGGAAGSFAGGGTGGASGTGIGGIVSFSGTITGRLIVIDGSNATDFLTRYNS